jgi:hypothetical protein
MAWTDKARALSRERLKEINARGALDAKFQPGDRVRAVATYPHRMGDREATVRSTPFQRRGRYVIITWDGSGGYEVAWHEDILELVPSK